MSWREADLIFSGALPALSCSMVPAHPYIYGLGQETSNGNYLSPANACQYLAGKLANTGGTADTIVMMVASSSHSEFMTALNALAEVFPVPAFAQVARLSQSMATLATDKMQLPDKPRDVLPDAQQLSVSTARTMSASSTISSAQAAAALPASAADLESLISSFAATCAQIASDAAADAGDLSAKSARIQAFSLSGDLVTTASELVKNVPNGAAGYTAAMMFVAPDLSAINNMIHDVEGA